MLEEAKCELYFFESEGRILARIEQDAAAGFYLHIFESASGESTHDHLQDTLENAMTQAEEDCAAATAGRLPDKPPWTDLFFRDEGRQSRFRVSLCR